MANWAFTKNIGAINLEELIGGELRFRRRKYDAESGQSEIESHTLQITSDFISNDTLLVQPDGFSRILELTTSGDLTLYCDAGTATFLPWNYPTSLAILNVKPIDPMFISIPNDNILNGSAKGSLRAIYSAPEDDGYIIGEYAFAEGGGAIASGEASHAEGSVTIASGDASHAEGIGTTASGSYSHADGDSTKASGVASHAEGLYTTASSIYQHVQGKYNIEDTENKYAHIVGNGEYSDDGSRSANAHTLDWDGNAWFTGDVYVGSTSGKNKDEGSKKLATEEYVNTEMNQKSQVQFIIWEEED
jgi:hypothetical protein